MHRSAGSPVYEFGGFTLDAAQRRLLSPDGQVVKLTPRVFDTLLCFVEHAGELLDKATLMRAIWPDTVVEDNNLNQAITALRKSLNDTPDEHRFITTDPGRGYRFVAEVRLRQDSPKADQRSNWHRSARQRLLLLISGLLLVAVGYLAIEKFYYRNGDVPATAPAPMMQSVAVLPFMNLSDDERNEYFAEGLSETLLHMLAQVPGLRVAARTSSFAFKGKNIDIRDIASALGVTYVLEGSVQPVGNRVRITAQLIRADDGLHVWSDNYDRTLDDIFAIQDEIARDVADAMGKTTRAGDTSRIQSISTYDFNAYDYYLKALGQQAKSAVRNADGLFRSALAIDPDFLEAKIGLARNLVLELWMTPFGKDSAISEASDLLTQVLDKRPGDVTARGLQILVRFYDAVLRMDVNGAWSMADELLPLMDEGYGDSFARRQAAVGLMNQQRFDEALTLLRNGLVVDPLNYDLLFAQAAVFDAMGRLDEARLVMMTALDIAPDNPLSYWYLSIVTRNQPEESLDWLRKGSEVDPANAVLSGLIAGTLYSLQLFEAADRWQERAQQGDGLWVQRWLEIHAAAARDRHAELLELTRQTVDQALEGQGDPRLVALAASYYSYEMHERGLSQQALDYVSGRLPELDDVTRLPDSWPAAMLQLGLFPLRSDVLETLGFRELAATYVDTLNAAGGSRFVPGLPGQALELQAAVWQGDLRGAKQLFFETLSDLPLVDPWWDHCFKSPWLAEFRDDPTVAARLTQVKRERQELRERVQRMLNKPEWRG